MFAVLVSSRGGDKNIVSSAQNHTPVGEKCEREYMVEVYHRPGEVDDEVDADYNSVTQNNF